MTYVRPDRLVYFRNKRNLSQKKAAELLGVSDFDVFKWEHSTDGASLTEEQILKIATTYNVSKLDLTVASPIISVKNIDIASVLSKMTENNYENLQYLRESFGTTGFMEDENEYYLTHLLVAKKYDETAVYKALKALMKNGFPADLRARSSQETFIEVALRTGYSEKFILKIFKLAIRCGLNPNEIENHYELLCSKGFDPDKTYRKAYKAMKREHELNETYTHASVKRFKKLYKPN